MSSVSRRLSYSLAINEALHQMMESDSSVFLIGQGVKSPWYVGNTATGLLERFGENRVIDTPVSENAITGAGVGAAAAGMRPIVVHPRMDFMLLAVDPIVNQASNWHYMSGGNAPCPVVFWGIINRGGEQGAQHSQALHALYAHFPGLKVVMPATPYDAKGLLVGAIRDNNPVVFIDDRWLYNVVDEVPEQIYEVPIGQAAVRVSGDDLTIVAISHAAHLALQAEPQLREAGISAEIVDLRTAKPIDIATIARSVSRTRRALVVDGAWRTCGLAAEVSALIHEHCFAQLAGPVARITLPDLPAPAARTLESAYYLSTEALLAGAQSLFR